MMVDVSQIGDRLYLIDNQLLSIPKWGAVYLLDEEKKALVDPGPTTSAGHVLDGLRKLGVRPEEIDYIVATHIHLDHSGGVGSLLKHMPSAKVLAHYRGTKHLIDPAKLVNAAIEARGSEWIERHGEVLPVEASRVTAVGEGDSLNLSDKQTLNFMDTPGHCSHELCILETRNGGVLTGDAVSAYIVESDILQPFHPPPQFDLQLCLSTQERLRKLAPRRFYYAHFGVSHQVQRDLRIVREKLMVWDGMVRQAVSDGSLEGLRVRLIAHACSEVEVMRANPSQAALYKYMTEVNAPLCADGHIKYYREVLKLF